MMRLRGQKRKIPIEKIQDNNSRAVAFSKRRNGLYRKTAELCRRFDCQIAILIASPSSRRSNILYSFGHSSVDVVVEAFLENRVLVSKKAISNSSVVSIEHVKEALKAERNKDYLRVKKQELGFWWEDDEVEMYENVEDLRIVIERLQKLKVNVKSRLKDLRKDLGSCSSGVAGDLIQLGFEKIQDFCRSSNDVSRVHHEIDLHLQEENSLNGHRFLNELDYGETEFNFDLDHLDYFNKLQSEFVLDSSSGIDKEGDHELLQLDDVTDIEEAQMSSDYQKLFQEFASCLS